MTTIAPKASPDAHGASAWADGLDPLTAGDRLAALARYDILDTAKEPGFDGLARLAAEICGTPVGLITFVDGERQFFKASVGFNGERTSPLDVGFCPRVVRDRAAVTLLDASGDPLHANNAAVTDGGVRFYAGVPLVTPDDHVLGTLCVLDTEPRPSDLTPRERQSLEALAGQVMSQLELRRSEATSRRESARAEKHTRRLSLIAEASSLLLAARDPAATVRDLFAILRRGFEVDIGFHYRCGEGALGLVAATGLTKAQERSAVRLEFGQTVCGIVAERREPMHVAGIQGSDEELFRPLKRLGLESYYSTPLLAGGDLLGTISFGRRGRDFSPGELEALRTITSQLATSLERQHAERALRTSERETRFILKAGRFGAWTLDVPTGELTTSEICRINFGRDPETSFTYEALRDAVHPDDRARMAGAVEDSLATGADYDIEYRIITATGEVRWVLIRAQPAYDPDGAPRRMSGVSIDITDRKRDEARKASLSDLADAIREMQDPDEIARAAAGILGRTLGVSRVGYALFDPDPETSHLGREWSAPGVAPLAGVLPLRDHGPLVEELKRGKFISIPDVRDDARTSVAAEALERRGARALVSMPVIEQGRLAAVLYVASARARAWSPDELALVREVGERTRMAVERSRIDLALAQSEMRYSALFNSVEQGFCVFDMIFDEAGRPADYVFVEVNPAFEAQTGLVDAVGRRMSELGPGHEQRWYDLYGQVALTGTPLRVEEFAQAMGRWYEIYAYRIGDPGERRVAALFNDVSERKLAEARVRELNETLERQVAARTSELRQYRDIVDATTSPICAFDKDFRLIAFNRAHNDEFRRVNGFDTQVGDVFPDLFIPEQRPVMRALMARALSGEVFTVKEEFGRPELGQPCWEISYTPLRDGEGAIIGAFHLATDISDQLRADAELAAAQEALRQSQKMEAMGSLTGGVAHDFNNLLTPIVGSLDMLQRRGLGGEREQRLIAGAIQSADRAKTLVQRLLAFARRQPLQPTAVDLSPLVRGMADLISSTTGPQIRVVVDAAEGLPPAKADPNQLEMAVLNLAVNARDAMADGGTLRISVDAETVVSPHRASVAPGPYLRLSVDDTGSGMDEATLKQAIEPFFSTKGVGKGTGLGLSMVHGLASQLGGALTIRSAVGVGTTVELWLPQSQEAAPQIDVSDDASKSQGGGGLVLLVDDEDMVRLSTSDMLTELGYTVVEAASAEEALGLIEGGLRPDLLVTDHLMPGMDGTHLARELRARHPSTKALIVSGYAESEGIEPDMPRLVKPFRSAELADSLAAFG